MISCVFSDCHHWIEAKCLVVRIRVPAIILPPCRSLQADRPAMHAQGIAFA